MKNLKEAFISVAFFALVFVVSTIFSGCDINKSDDTEKGPPVVVCEMIAPRPDGAIVFDQITLDSLDNPGYWEYFFTDVVKNDSLRGYYWECSPSEIK